MSEEVDVMDATRLREAMMSVTRQARRHRPAHALTLSQMTILGDLDRHGTATIAELADRSQVRVQSLTLSMNRLDELGFITRTTDPSDRRRQLIDLSDTGRKVLAEDRVTRDAWLASAMAELTDTERGVLMLAVPVLGKLADF